MRRRTLSVACRSVGEPAGQLDEFLGQPGELSRWRLGDKVAGVVESFAGVGNLNLVGDDDRAQPVDNELAHIVKRTRAAELAGRRRSEPVAPPW